MSISPGLSLILQRNRMDKKKIVEVFIETDEEDESFSSSSDEGEGGGARPVGTQWQEALAYLGYCIWYLGS